MALILVAPFLLIDLIFVEGGRLGLRGFPHWGDTLYLIHVWIWHVREMGSLLHGVVVLIF